MPLRISGLCHLSGLHGPVGHEVHFHIGESRAAEQFREIFHPLLDGRVGGGERIGAVQLLRLSVGVEIGVAEGVLLRVIHLLPRIAAPVGEGRPIDAGLLPVGPAASRERGELLLAHGVPPRIESDVERIVGRVERVALQAVPEVVGHFGGVFVVEPELERTPAVPAYGHGVFPVPRRRYGGVGFAVALQPFPPVGETPYQEAR